MMPFCNQLERDLVDALRRMGRSISAQELAAALRIDARKARALVSHLRADHHVPIASTPAEGFSYPRSRGDVERTVAQIRSRVVELERTADGLEIGAEELFGTPEGQLALGLGR